MCISYFCAFLLFSYSFSSVLHLFVSCCLRLFHPWKSVSFIFKLLEMILIPERNTSMHIFFFSCLSFVFNPLHPLFYNSLSFFLFFFLLLHLALAPSIFKSLGTISIPEQKYFDGKQIFPPFFV